MSRRTLTAALAAIFLAACGGSDAPAADAAATDAAPVAASPSEGAMASEAASSASLAMDELPQIVVYKTEFCGCCNGWIEHLEAAGFQVEARNVQDLTSVKMDAGVPTSLSSCHTALIDGYVVEGHVPADAVKKLLAERPQVAGIATPGMPIGSPGMEGPNAEPYTVEAFTADGSHSTFAEIDPR